MGEQIRRPPQQLDSRLRLLLLELRGDRVQIGVGFAQRGSVGSHVAIVEAVIRNAQLGNQLKRDVDAFKRVLNRFRSVVPGTLQRRRAERVGPRRAKRVPVADAEPQQIMQRLPLDDFFRVVVLKGQRVFALRAFVLNLRDLGEVGHGCTHLQIKKFSRSFEDTAALPTTAGPLHPTSDANRERVDSVSVGPQSSDDPAEILRPTGSLTSSSNQQGTPAEARRAGIQ